jgi:hypothetical protein
MPHVPRKLNSLRYVHVNYMSCLQKPLTMYQEAFSKYLAGNSSASSKPAATVTRGKDKQRKKNKAKKEKPSFHEVEVIGAPTYQNQNIHFWTAAMLGVGNVYIIFICIFANVF